MNILFCSVGRRGELIRDFRKTMGGAGTIVAVDNSNTAPALYLADKRYLVPRIDSPDYIDVLIDICHKEKIDVITTLIDPEIELLSTNRDRFEQMGILLLAPKETTAKLCFDKYKMYQYLSSKGIPTVLTYGSWNDFYSAYKNGEIGLPVFVKPRTGSGSVGARIVSSLDELKMAIDLDSELIIQENVSGDDVDADVYVDTVSHELVSAFTKRKLGKTIGGANKTVSFKDEAFFAALRRAVSVLDLIGPADMDFFIIDGEYVLSEVNPRFGGAYLHAYAAGIDFVKLIENNVAGIANEPAFGNYDEGLVMMMFDSVVIKRIDELV